MTDPDWWKGKCLGRIGYFPSKYCARLTAGEKPLQVIQNLQLSDGERNDGIVTLLRDQIVVQVNYCNKSSNEFAIILNLRSFFSLFVHILLFGLHSIDSCL